jgi:hypothetical protein
VEYMGMAGCWREACDLGAMIEVMFKCIGYYSGIYYLVYGHAYAALSSRCFLLLVMCHEPRDIVQDGVLYRMAGSK